MSNAKIGPDSKLEDIEFFLRLDVVECWHILETHADLSRWRWFLSNVARDFTVDHTRAELRARPESPLAGRASDLIDLIDAAARTQVQGRYSSTSICGDANLLDLVPPGFSKKSARSVAESS
jgi:hypothetical protein